MKSIKIKVLLFCLGISVLMALTSCQNFIRGEEVKNQILDTIAYNNAPSVTVLLKTDPEYGDFFSDGEKSFKVGYDTEVQFTVNQDAFVFKKLEAVTRTAPYQDRSSVVQFTTVDADEKKGIYKIKVKILEKKDDIMIRPVCEPLPKIESITPVLEAYGCNQDSAITITFNKAMNVSSFKDQKGKIKGISITNQNGDDLSSYFAEPCFASDNKTLYIQPLCLSDNTKFILPPDGTKNSLNIEVEYTFINASDADGFTFTVTGSHTYKINKSFTNQENITILVQNSNANYGSFFAPGEKSSIVGFGFEIEFTLNQEAYTFEGFEAVSKNTEENRASFIAFENEQFDSQTGICKAMVRILKYSNDIRIRPKCNDITNSEVQINGPTKGTKIITPANGTKVKSYINHEYSLGFVPDDDYEFIRWEIFNTTSDSTIQNGTYITIENPKNADTVYTITQVPENTIKLDIRAVVAERPRVISKSPITSGMLKDSTIVVLFDKDMDENSIYWLDKKEIDALKQEFSLTDDDFLPENAVPGQTKIYGYKKDGQTYFKNISITNKKTGDNIAFCFDKPVFEDPSTLSIPVKDKGKDLKDYTQILVSIEKEFFYKVDGKDVQLAQSERWMYQVNDQIDETPLIFATQTIEDENQQTSTVDLFSVKLSKDGNKLKEPATNTVSGTLDYTKISALDFMKDRKLYFDIKVQEPEGSGPKPYFTAYFKQIYDSNYNSVSSSTEISKDIYYDNVTADDAMIKSTVDFSDINLQDGIYKLYFKFSDRSENSFTYPKNSKYYYITKDETPITPSGLKITSSNSNDYTISWTAPTEKDYKEAVISWGNGTDNTTIAKGTNAKTFTVSKSSVFNIAVTYKDFSDNLIVETIPAFLTGYEFRGTPSFAKYAIENVFFNGDSFSDYGLLNSISYWSDGTTSIIPLETVTTTPSYQKQYITITYSQDGDERIDVTKTAKLGATQYYVAAAGAKLTSTPVKLTGYSGSLDDGTYYTFGDFPQTISKISNYSSETVYNNWYLGSDGYFYEKCAENGYNSGSYKYSNNENVGKNGSSYKYFKVEPIVWRRLGTSDNLLSEKVLNSGIAFCERTQTYNYYYTTTYYTWFYQNDWDYSLIKAYLNGGEYYTGDTPKWTAGQSRPDYTYNVDKRYYQKGFLQKAFVEKDRSNIKYKEIFILTHDDVTNSSYGFSSVETDSGKESGRVRNATDYALANGVMCPEGTKCQWWLADRANGGNNYVMYIYASGGAYSNFKTDVKDKYNGIVPALRVSDINLLQ